MTSGSRFGRAPGSGGKRNEHHHSFHRRQPLATLLCIALVMVTVSAAVWTRPAGLARAQDESAASDTSTSGQVIAQGIARLPRGEVVWTVRGIDVSGDAGTAVESFPVGFAIAGDATIALQDSDGEVLNILEAGEAAFLPNGRSGALASWDADAASLYEIALVSEQDASAGETAGTLVGEPFAAPEGEAFDIELAHETLTPGEQTTIPISRSGAPVLFLGTAGSTQLEGGNGQIVELTTGQFALLAGEVIARGASDGPSTFVVAAIGEATAARDAAEAGTPEARAGREGRRQAREAGQGEAGAQGEAAGGEAATQGEDTTSAEGTRERRPKRVRTGGGGGDGGGGGRGGGGQAGQTAPQGTGGGTSGGTGDVPITGGVDTTVPAGTPAVESPAEPTLPEDTTATADGTPPTDDTTLPDDAAPVEEPAAPEDEVPAATTGDEVPPEETSEEEPPPSVDAPPAEDTAPVEEAPVEEVPVEDTAPVEPVVEEEVTEPAAGS